MESANAEWIGVMAKVSTAVAHRDGKSFTSRDLQERVMIYELN